MRLCTRIFMLVVVGVLPSGAASSTEAQPAVGVQLDIGFFYDELAPHGDWVLVERHGWVWTPHNVPPGWRPYTVGRWVYCDDYGWTWASDWEWGWAPFHYGRWYHDSLYGWTWIPGTEWGPAWVAWRSGSGYIGWAPLPPEAPWRVGVGFDLGRVNLDVAIAPTSWCFVEERLILTPRVREYVVLPARNVTIIRSAPYVTRYTVVGNRVVNLSLSVERVERVVGHRVTRSRVVALDSAPRAYPRDFGGTEIRVFRPVISKAAPSRAPRTFSAGRRAIGPDELTRRQEASRQRLQGQQQAERSRLEELHRRDATSPPRGLSPEQIRERQAAERRAMEEEHRRRDGQLRRWHGAERDGKVQGPKIRKAEARDKDRRPPTRRKP
ncbi:MAG: DUF6600 domain-containing protein [Phycisphaerae bacterium]